MRRYSPIKPSRGTVIPSKIREAVKRRDGFCVGPAVGMPGRCQGGIEIDHVRASHGMGMKSETESGNLVSLCGKHHIERTLNGRTWRPLLLAYIEKRESFADYGRGAG